MSIPSFDWLQDGTPFFYWYIYFIFGPAFTFGWWGLAGMVLIHIIIWSFLLWVRRKAAKKQSFLRRFLGALGLLVLTNLLSGLLVYGTIWILAQFTSFLR